MMTEAPTLPAGRSGEELEAWLRNQPPEVSIALAARAALRVLPFVRVASRAGLFSKIVVPVFRATAVSWASAKYPALKAEFAARAVPAANTNAYAAQAAAYAAATAAAGANSVPAIAAAAYAFTAAAAAIHGEAMPSSVPPDSATTSV